MDSLKTRRNLLVTKYTNKKPHNIIILSVDYSTDKATGKKKSPQKLAQTIRLSKPFPGTVQRSACFPADPTNPAYQGRIRQTHPKRKPNLHHGTNPIDEATRSTDLGDDGISGRRRGGVWEFGGLRTGRMQRGRSGGDPTTTLGARWRCSRIRARPKKNEGRAHKP